MFNPCGQCLCATDMGMLTPHGNTQVHGTCLGLEVLTIIAAQNSTLLSK